MSLEAAYSQARRDEEIARLRRSLALRAMVVAGMSQRRIATALGISQSAVSQQLSSAPRLDVVHPGTLVEAAGPVLRAMASDLGYRRLAVFGSVARGTARSESDIDLIVDPPAGSSTFDFVRFQGLIEEVLGRSVDLVDYGGLQPIDADIRRDAVLL